MKSNKQTKDVLAVMVNDLEFLAIGTDFDSVTMSAYLEAHSDMPLEPGRFQKELREFRVNLHHGYSVKPYCVCLVKLNCTLKVAKMIEKDYFSLLQFVDGVGSVDFPEIGIMAGM